MTVGRFAVVMAAVILALAAGVAGQQPPDASRAPGAPVTATPAAAPVARPFRREAALETQTLQRFRGKLASAARKDFDDGVASLTAGDFVKAEVSFKNAQRAGGITSSGAAALTYLGATYAASGHDLEAANVWQNALIDGSEYPQIYEWLADTLVRVRRFEDARSTLKEALEKWPSDARFAERLATVPALPNAPNNVR